VQQKYRSVRRTVATFTTGKPDEEDNALTDSDQQYRNKSTNVARMGSLQWAQCRLPPAVCKINSVTVNTVISANSTHYSLLHADLFDTVRFGRSLILQSAGVPVHFDRHD
jgi:hypothetical protein